MPTQQILMMIPNTTDFEVTRRRHPLVGRYHLKRQPVFLESVLDPLFSSRALKKQRVYTRRIFDGDEEDNDSFSVKKFVPDRLSLLQQSQDKKRYELIDNADKFELRLDVPGVKQEDIDIKIDDDKNLIVKGTRVYETETAKAKSKFKQMFSLEKAVDVDHFSATLKDGVLVVTAPKLNRQLLEKSRKIPIVCIDDGIRAGIKPNLENKETKDKVEATLTEDKSSKNDCVEKGDQRNEKESLNSEDETQPKSTDHDDDNVKSTANKPSAEKHSEKK